MDKLERKKKCLFCFTTIKTLSAEEESIPFKKTKLFYNCAQTLCNVLDLPSYPFEYFFDNAGYCQLCRLKVEDLELAVQKIVKLKETIESIRGEIEVGVKSAHENVGKSYKKTSISSMLPRIGDDVKTGDTDDLLKNKFTYKQVVNIIVERLDGSAKANDDCFYRMFANNNSDHNFIEADIKYTPPGPPVTTPKRGRPSKNSTNEKKSVLPKSVVKLGDNRKVKRGRKKRQYLNPVVVLEKIDPDITTFTKLKVDLPEPGCHEEDQTENNGLEYPPGLEQNDKSWSDNDTIVGITLLSDSAVSKGQPKGTRKRRTNVIKKVKKEKPPDVIMKCSVDTCTETFNKKADLNAHIKDIHPGLKHNCDKCDKQYLNRKHLLDHQKTKHSGVATTYDCEICGIKFSYGKGLKAHRIRKHKAEYPDLYESYIQNKSGDPIPCIFENCPEVFALKMDLGAHIKEFHKGERRFECEDCGKRYISKKHLATHKNLKHSGRYPVVCDKCGKTFNFYKTLLKHMEMQHSEDHLFSCYVCSKTFEDSSELEKHAAIHLDDIPFRCDICNTMFTNSRDLQQHVRSHRSTTAKCNICGKMYSSQKNLKDHLLGHNDISTWPKCEVCHKPFKSPRHLRKHMIVHSTENQFQCELCGEGFKYSSYLLKHNRRKHTMLRPFNCLICNKGFYETTQLKRHEEIHSGFKKYICDICGKAFRTLQNHYQHYRTHNKEYRSQMMYKNLKRKALKSSRKKQVVKQDYSKIEVDVNIVPDLPEDLIDSTLLSDSLEEHPIIIQCTSPMLDDDRPGHLIPIPADEIQTYYEQGDTIVVVNDMEYHKFIYID